MPIVFAPPEPFSQQISQGAGAAEQFDKTLPTLSQLYIAAGRERAAGAGQAFGQAAQAQAQQASQNFQGQQQAGAEAFAGQQQAAGIAGQMGLQQQHAENQAWVSQQQLSQAENLRLQRMQSAVGEIQNRMQNGTMTAEDGNDALTQLRTGIDPMKQRQERWQQQLMQQSFERSQTVAGQQDLLFSQQQDFHNSRAQDNAQVVVDERNGSQHIVAPGERGGRPIVPADFGRTPGQRTGAGGEGTGTTRGGHHNESTDDQLLAHATAIARGESRTADGHEGPIPAGRVQEIHRDLINQRDERRPETVDQDAVQTTLWRRIREAFPNLSLRQQSDLLQQALPGALQQAQEAARNSPRSRQAAARRQAEDEVGNRVRNFPGLEGAELATARRNARRADIEQRMQEILAAPGSQPALPPNIQGTANAFNQAQGQMANVPPSANPVVQQAAANAQQAMVHQNLAGAAANRPLAFNPRAENLTPAQRERVDYFNRRRNDAREHLTGNARQDALDDVEYAERIFSEYGSMDSLAQNPRDFENFRVTMSRLANLTPPPAQNARELLGLARRRVEEHLGWHSQPANNSLTGR